MIHRPPRALLLAAAGILTLACASPQPRRRPEDRQAQQYFRLAQVDFAEGRNQEAIEHLRKSIDLDPKNADVHGFLGVVYLLLSDYEKAEKSLDQALRINPYLTDARNSLGAVYLETGRTEKARGQFEEALKDRTYPTPEKIFFNLGSLELEEKRYPQALESFRKAVSANPNYARAHLGMGRALAATGRGAEARRHFEKVIAIDPKSPDAARARELLGQLTAERKG
jgi:type IV pilus biogenesis/stability protein PilW